MASCAACGLPKKEGLEFCTGCGTRFPRQEPAVPRRSLRAAGFGMLIAVLLAGATYGLFLMLGHQATRESALSGNDSSRASDSAGRSPATDNTPQVSASAGAVTISAAVGQDQDASSVADFIGTYFAAINSRDYAGYISLFGPQYQSVPTSTQFTQGFSSTTDSSETLTGISASADGDLVATVTFTSHQDSADSPTGNQTCTQWSVSFFLLAESDGYLIDRPPASYHATYAGC
jgi:hypothetical protein